jgi:hypothetical protein
MYQLSLHDFGLGWLNAILFTHFNYVLNKLTFINTKFITPNYTHQERIKKSLTLTARGKPTIATSKNAIKSLNRYISSSNYSILTPIASSSRPL